MRIEPIEMMVVLVIIALVAAMIVPNVIGRPNEARVAVAKTDVRAIASALELYRLDNRTYPTTVQGLGALVRRPTSAPEPSNWVMGGIWPNSRWILGATPMSTVRPARKVILIWYRLARMVL